MSQEHPVRRGRPPRHPDDLASTREVLVHAGMELFTEQGFGTTGIDTILRRVGIPKGSFYYYFDSKAAFGREVLAAYDAYFLRKLDRWFARDDIAPLDRLVAFVADAKRGLKRHEFTRGCLVGNLGQEIATLPDGFRHELDAMLGRWQKRTADCLRLAREHLELASDADCDELAAFFWIGWEGAVLRSRLVRSVRPLDIFATAFLNSLPRP